MIRTFSFILIFIIAGNCLKSSAQSMSVAGEVRDSVTNYTLSGVTVAAYFAGDSSLMDVQLTNNTGKFRFNKNLKVGGIDLYITFTGYHTFHQMIHVDSSEVLFNIGTIKLLRNYEQLEEVLIQAAPPVSMNGDTLEINPAAFRMGSDVVVEDLLRRVSGVEVWGDGTITVNGRKVDHVYVDGKPFISDNARIATQNLPKGAVEKIQVYQEKSNELSSLTSDSLLTMNIKLKEDHKNGLLGKISAGYGTSGRYDLGITGILFTRRSRLALAGLSNNINKKTSGVQAALESNTYKNNNPNLTDAADFEMDGQNSDKFYGATFQHSFKPKKRMFLANDIRAEITHSENKNDLNSEVSQSAIINSDKQTSHFIITSNTHTNQTQAAISYTKRNSNTDYSIAANLNSSDDLLRESNHTTQNFNGTLSSKTRLSNITDNQARGVSVEGKYNYSDIKNLGLKSLNINYAISYHQDLGKKSLENQFQSFIDSISDLSLNRNYNLRKDITKGDFYLSYPGLKRLLLNKRDIPGLEISLDNQLHVSNENSANRVQDFDSTSKIFIANSNLTYNNNLDSIQLKPALSIRKSFGRYLSGRFERNFIFRLNLQGDILALNNSSTLSYRNLNRSFFFFEPEMVLTYDHQNNNHQVTVAYKGNFENIVPEIDQLFPVTDDINPYYIRFGNAFLGTEHITLHKLSIEYKRVKPNSHHHFTSSLDGTYRYSKHAISDSILNDEAGRKILFPVNVSYRRNWVINLLANYSLKFDKNLLQFQYRGNMNKITVPGFINSEYHVSDYLFLNNEISIAYAFSDIVTTELRQNIFINQFKLSNSPNVIQRNNLYQTGLNTNLHPLPSIIFSNSLNVLNNPSLDNRFLLWNVYFTWRFLKNERGELKLSALDLLKNYKNIKTDIGYNFNSTTVNSSLQQFFMVRFSYYPRYY